MANEFPEFENSQLRCRASDFNPVPPFPPPGPTNVELMKAIEGLTAELREFKHSMGALKTAFPRNDLGEPDFDGHRIDHVTRIKHAQQFEGLKFAATMRFVGAVCGVVGLIFMTGLSTHLQKFIGG